MNGDDLNLMPIALLDSNKRVVAIIEQGLPDDDQQYVVIPEGMPCGLGWKWTGKRFVEPAP